MNRSHHPSRRNVPGPHGSVQGVTPTSQLGPVATMALSTIVSIVLAHPLMAQSTPNPSPALLSPTASWAVSAAEAALKTKNYTGAVQHYRTAVQVGTEGEPSIASRIAAVRQQLVLAGIDAALLQVPAATPSATIAPPSASSTSVPTTAAGGMLDRVGESRRLTAIGRAALNRGDAATAYDHARRATALGVRDHEFAPGDARPWQLLLDSESMARQQGLDVASLAANAGGVVPASTQTIPNSFAGQAIAQAGGIDDATAAAAWPIAQVQAEQGTPTNDGVTLFEDGMKLLAQGNKVEARAKFVEAWKYESDLDVQTRRSLQDKLTLLQPSRLPSTAASASNTPMTAIEKAELEAQAQTRRLYREVTAELAKANEKREEAPLEAVDDLERVIRRIEGANVDSATKSSLTAMVRRALAEQNAYVEAHRADIELNLANEAIRMDLATKDERQARIDDEISALVETYNDYMEQQRYAEAEVIAKQVSELKPGSQIAQQMFHNSRMKTRIQIDEEITDMSEDGFARTMLDLGRTAIPIDPERPFQFPEPRTWEGLSRLRTGGEDADSMLSPKEQAIQRTLSTQEVQLNYKGRALGEVIEDLSALAGIPMVMDTRALEAVRVTRDTPITQTISQPISLKSALSIMLKDLDLTYMLENDVLSITSREARRTNVRTQTYRVADLVTPIPNFVSGYEQGLAGALKSAYQMIQPTTDVQVMPVSVTDLGGGMASSRNAVMNPNMLGQYSPGVSGGGFAGGGLGSGGALRGGAGGGALADFDSLMNLIQTTIEPDTWEALGGVGTMAPYPQNLSLVISTTSDVHDQIVDLLESLRRLQNLQITIEVRFITLADTFFEQIGIDFDVQFDDNASSLPNDDSGEGVTIGLSAPGTPTPDLDIRFENNSAGVISPFGAPDAGAISSIGFAILSDIEAFFFLQAAQGDNRSNIMQAPKVTMFDGQIATISDFTQRPFVTSVIPVVGDFAVAQQPVIVVLDEGTKLNVQAVVSDDKRFVRVTLVPTFSQIGEVNTFTFQGSTSSRTQSGQTPTTDNNGDGVIDQNDQIIEDDTETVTQGTTVQQPTFASTTVSTTVSVPDGGTILLGGIKRMSEGRAERGVPFLSKIPYLSRLFRNTAIGRDSRSLMLMVTPRIIIQEEEEIAQTGYNPSP